MKGTTTRILILAGLALVIQGIAYSARLGLKPAHVEKPDRDFLQMDLGLNDWTSETIDLKSENPELYGRIGADVVVDRVYRSPAGETMKLHCAVFREYDVGAFHLPTNCYRSQGWQLDNQESITLEGPDGTKSVNLLTWTQGGKQTELACYWYQLDEHIVLSRLDLGIARWKLGGRETWPPLVKVLITGVMVDPERSPGQMHEFAQRVYSWINSPVDQLNSTPSAVPANPAN